MKNANNNDISRRNFIEKLAYGTLGVSIMQPFSSAA